MCEKQVKKVCERWISRGCVNGRLLVWVGMIGWNDVLE